MKYSVTASTTSWGLLCDIFAGAGFSPGWLWWSRYSRSCYRRFVPLYSPFAFFVIGFGQVFKDVCCPQQDVEAEVLIQFDALSM